MTGHLVDVAVQVPRLAVDRPFTYRLPESMDAGLGSLVQVPFHGRIVKAWVLGPAAEEPKRVADVRKVLSPVRFFDERLLELYRWVSHRYLTPLSVAIDRGIPPRIVSEESAEVVRAAPPDLAGAAGAGRISRPDVRLIRPARGRGAEVAVSSVGAALAAGTTALVLVPEAEGHLTRAVQEAFGDAAVSFIGGEDRERYRTWLDILGGRYRVVVGTRPAVFAPLPDLGLIWVDRETHAAHREPRSPSWHVRDVALARGRIQRASVSISSAVPSAEALAAGLREVAPSRGDERRAWAVVETVKPGPEGRAPRLVQALRAATSGFLLSSRGGYGVARVCKRCGQPAACARCSGMLEQRKGSILCAVCGAAGECANCGGREFGVQRRGAERVAEWAASLAPVPVAEAEGPPDRGAAGVTVGTPASVPDAGPRDLDLVGILDADPMLTRPGLSGPEQVVATWFEAAAWARRRPQGRVIVETAEPGHPAIQALVRTDPDVFARADRARRTEAGFPPGHPVFRIVGTAAVADRLEAMRPANLLVSGVGDERVCLVTVAPDALDELVTAVRTWARAGEVRRVEAEPHL